MFLQAAGMPSKTVRALASKLETDDLSWQRRALAEFAEKLSSSPPDFSADDAAAIRRALPTEGDVLEAAMVTGAFNYANRCADALGVRQEVPVMLEAYPNLRWGVMKLLSWGIRFKTDFRNRVPRQVCADDILESLASDLKQAGLGNVPAFFEALRPRPDLLYVQSMATRAVLLETSLPRKMVLSLVYLISRLNGDVSWETDAAASLRQLGAPLESVSDLSRDDGMNGWFTRPEWEMLRFAQDITFRADETTDEQVELLRHSGLSDLLILDLVAISAAVNAMNRLNRVLACHQADQPVEKLSDSSAPSYPCSSLYSSNHAI